MTIDELSVNITADIRELKKQMDNADKSIGQLKNTADKTANSVTNTFQNLTKKIAGLGIGVALANSVRKGMSAIEDDNLFGTVMGSWVKDALNYSNKLENILGVSAIVIRRNMGVIYNMATSMGVAEKQAYKMSKGIATLAEDMASFYNIRGDEAFNKLRAGITGETEPLKALGILVDENTIKQYALKHGIAKAGNELTTNQKVLARYMAILDQTKNAHGDLARTIDSPANQVRLFKQNLQGLSIAISNFVIPAFGAVMPYINAFIKVLTIGLNLLGKFAGFKAPAITNSTKTASKNVGGIASGLGKANKEAEKLKGTLAGFDKMEVINTPDKNKGNGKSGNGSGARTEV